MSKLYKVYKAGFHFLARFLARQLQAYAKKKNSYIKNEGDFIEHIKAVDVEPDDLLVVLMSFFFHQCSSRRSTKSYNENMNN